MRWDRASSDLPRKRQNLHALSVVLAACDRKGHGGGDGPAAVQAEKTAFMTRPVMIEAQQKCLAVLAEITTPNGEMCVPFAPIQRHTEYDRKTVRRHVRALARKGFAEYFRGLITEDGDFAGAGYCITKAGLAVYEDGAK